MRTDLRRHQELLAELNELFPLKNPKVTDDINTIRFNSGMRYVVDYLNDELLHQQQSFDVLGDPR
jgi:hypothetical protein